MAKHNELGAWGEEQAAMYLQSKGWYIRNRDWRYGHRDIDIVAIDAESSIVLIVEVKTRASNVHGEPDEAIDLEKQNNIIRAAAAYMRSNRLHYCEFRYDTISVVGTPDTGATITHKENAFDITSTLELQQENYRKRKYLRRPGRW